MDVSSISTTLKNGVSIIHMLVLCMTILFTWNSVHSKLWANIRCEKIKYHDTYSEGESTSVFIVISDLYQIQNTYSKK